MVSGSGTTVKRLLIGVAIGVLLGSNILAIPQAKANHNFWVNCNDDTDYVLSRWTRSEARSYAAIGAQEGYHWGGGCWNNNNIDDQPGDPVEQKPTHGEGGDCSGFTFKSWAMRYSTTQFGFRYWPRLHIEHGPFTSTDFKNAVGPQLANVAKSSTVYMDAFAKVGHIGMIYLANSGYNTDVIIEARGESFGTNYWSQTYRGQSAYVGVRREGGCLWEGTCWP